MNEERDGHEHVPHVSKHHSDEEPKGDHVEGSRVYFIVGWHPVSIHYLLRHLHHAVAVKFAGRHLVTLDDVEGQRRQTLLRLDDQRHLLAGNVESEPGEGFGDFSGGEGPVDFPLLLGIEFYLAEPAANPMLPDLCQPANILPDAFEGEVFHGLNVVDFMFFCLQFSLYVPFVLAHDVAVHDSQQFIDFIQDHPSFSFGEDDEADHLILEGLSCHFAVLVGGEKPVDLFNGDFYFVDPAVAPRDAEDAALDQE